MSRQTWVYVELMVDEEAVAVLEAAGYTLVGHAESAEFAILLMPSVEEIRTLGEHHVRVIALGNTPRFRTRIYW